MMFLVLLFLSVSSGKSENYNKYSETGQTFVKYFSPKVYDALPDNWTIIQDNRGVMYFGNESGILEYDGTEWRKIQVPNSANVRSMTVADDGTIYVCASGDFGYLRPDSTGQMKYQSLKPFLDKKFYNSGEMWDVAADAKDVFFKTKDKIFKWDGYQISVIDSVFAFRLYKIDDKIYSRNQDVGLMVIDGDSVKVMPDGGFFADIGVYDMLPVISKTGNQKEKILVTTNYSGLFIHDGTKFYPFKTDVDSFLIKSQVYNACILADGNIALATQRGGVVIIDTEGQLVRFIDENSGLPTNVIYDVYADRQDGLWLATNNGIVYCETPSPFSIFNNSGALKNMSSSVIRFDDIIYLTNDLGVLYLSDEQFTFKLVEGSNKPAYELFDAGDVLLAGTNWGLVVVYDKKIKKFLVNAITERLITSKIFPGRIYAGTGDGLIVIQKQKNRFKVEYTFETPDYVDAIVEEKDGGLWLGGDFLGLFHVSGDMKALSDGIDKDVNFDYYNKQNGLPGETWKIFEVQNKMLLATELGVFAFDEETQRFIPDSTLGDNISGPQNTISLIEKSTDNNLWIISQQNGKNELGKAFLQKDGRYKWNPIPEFRRLELGSSTAVYSDYDEKSKNEILWISTKDALVRYNPDIKNNIRINYSTLIRKVSVEDDSLIYGGAPRSGKANNSSILPFSSNNINFYFSAVSFDKPEDTRYQYFLDGNDEEWSKWTSDSKKNYTNLSGGTYTFRVRSKNGYGTTGREDFFHFTVLPPWYLTWWAYTLYGLMVLAGVFAADRIGRRIVIRNERDRAKLREAELVKKQAEELETVDKLVRVINKADDLETLFKSLLERTISFIPQAEKAALFLRDHDKNLFRVAYTSGYQVDDLSNISFLPEELKNRYTVNSEEIEERIYIVSKTGDLPGDEKFISFKKANSMLVMAVEWENELEAYVVFDSFSESKAFDLSAARILNRFRVHAVSAISKARSLKMLQEKTEKIIKTQEQLVTQEKLASLGQLTAGIAHEIKNPLNFVINFAGISSELLQELQQVLESQKDKISLTSWAEIDDIIKTLEENSAKINEHGKRADNIVRSMLQHSRGKLGERRATDINAMLEENISFAFHSFRAQDISFNITIEKDFDSSVGKPDVVPQDLSRVFLNIIQNAFYAASPSKPKGNNDVNSEQKALSDKIIAEHARLGSSPTIWIKTKNLGNKIEIRIGDNGPGIPKEIHDKIFNPFFSTKSSGEGTGLGLSIAYDIIVKEHGGEIRFESTEYEFTEFIISLPNLNGSKT